jgi:hypothetical protein
MAAIEAVKAAGGIPAPDPNSTKTPQAALKRAVLEEFQQHQTKQTSENKTDDIRDAKRQKLMDTFHLSGSDGQAQDAKSKVRNQSNRIKLCLGEIFITTLVPTLSYQIVMC